MSVTLVFSCLSTTDLLLMTKKISVNKYLLTRINVALQIQIFATLCIKLWKCWTWAKQMIKMTAIFLKAQNAANLYASITANGELRVLKLHLNALCQIMITLLKDRKDTTTVHFGGLWAGQALFRKMHYIISFSFISTSR